MDAGYDASGDALLAVRVLVAEQQAVIGMDLVQMLGRFGCIALGPVQPREVPCIKAGTLQSRTA